MVKSIVRKGFTLVEVIVILAILVAIMIPALTGYIEKAKKKSAVVEARSVLLALQTVALTIIMEMVIKIE